MYRRWLIVALMLGSMAMAQDTTSCASLLELAFSRDMRPAPVPIETMEGTIEVTQTVEGQEIVFSAYSVFDFRSERMYQAISYDGEPTMILRFQDGQATMEVPGAGAQLPAPPQLLTQLEDTYRSMLADGPSDLTRIVGNGEIVSCDGPVAYGDVLAGEQVTVRTSGGLAMMDGFRAGTPLRAVFSGGELAGVIQDVPEIGEMIAVFDAVLVDSDGTLEGLVSSQYHWDGTTADPMGTMSMRYEHNAPIDESLFDP